MGFTNRKEKLEHDIWRAKKWLEDYPEKVKDLEFTKKNTEACLAEWEKELICECGQTDCPVEKDEK